MATICSCTNTLILQSNHFLLAENLHIHFLHSVCLNFIFLKLFQRNYTVDVTTEGHIRGHKQSLQLLTKTESGMSVQNPEAHWFTPTILVYIHTDHSLLFLTPTCQNICNSKRYTIYRSTKILFPSFQLSMSEIVLQAWTKIRAWCHKKFRCNVQASERPILLLPQLKNL